MSTLLEKHYAVLVSDHKALKRSYGQLKGSFERLKSKVQGLRAADRYSLEDVNQKIKQYQLKNEELAKANAKLVSQNRELSAKLRASTGGCV